VLLAPVCRPLHPSRAAISARRRACDSAATGLRAAWREPGEDLRDRATSPLRGRRHRVQAHGRCRRGLLRGAHRRARAPSSVVAVPSVSFVELPQLELVYETLRIVPCLDHGCKRREPAPSPPALGDRRARCWFRGGLTHLLARFRARSRRRRDPRSGPNARRVRGLATESICAAGRHHGAVSSTAIRRSPVAILAAPDLSDWLGGGQACRP
jgi:hypothetical protein